ncbi:M23 family metallopeptidase [Arenimonas oryziterrae]|uniref:M23ase beta-sheet core domain-containing protein n=1 Tax=Arenimonas oryziterrae DSM 21050 = YC6267 TaxID=1121015 RepID=A0A091AU81_9GAMM|nr:M23 family metallopeptidase [Arenimonas oryziterrae]KFN43783.1 hypothetical protein N789_07510 [Arenimonas oryziterrae DSM 21050 = YC6267]
MRAFVLSCLCLCAAASPFAFAADELDVGLSAAPGTVYVERLPDVQSLNFELLLVNRGAVALDIDRIQLSAYDAQGALLLRRLVDGNGVRPSIGVIDGRRIAPGQTLAVFNPFHSLARELPLARLHYDIDLSNEDGSHTLTRSLDVAPVAYENRSELLLPVRGRLINYDGHDFLGHHRRFDVHFAPIAAMGFTANFMRYSYDFVPVNAAGDMVAGDRAANENWFGFGADVRAVAAGTVVAVVNDQPDNRQFDQGKLATQPMVLFGNYVVIDHGHGEFGVYGHLRQGSAKVKPGQRVRAGETIAAIGASGSSLFPHLHFELQDGPDTRAEGLPSYFSHYARLVGTQRIARARLPVDTGEIVEAD